jgi:hypothetical protein
VWKLVAQRCLEKKVWKSLFIKKTFLNFSISMERIFFKLVKFSSQEIHIYILVGKTYCLPDQFNLFDDKNGNDERIYRAKK